MDFLFYTLLVITFILHFTQTEYTRSVYKRETGNRFKKVQKDKGLYGEYLIVNALETLPGRFKVVVNSYLPTKRGKTTETDVILIHRKGIYVIESKNYGGSIVGEKEAKNWFQHFPNGAVYPFYNPIVQNNIHVNALKNMLQKEKFEFSNAKVDLSKNLITSLIVFSDRCEIKSIPSSTKYLKITTLSNMQAVLKKDLRNKPVVLSRREIKEIYRMLKSFAKASKRTKKKHVKSIKRLKKAL